LKVALKSAVSPSSNMVWAIGSWTFFIAENAILSENRTRIIEVCGDDNYHYIYGSFSTAALASITWGYSKVKNIGPFAWSLASPVPVQTKVLSFVFLSTGSLIASQALPKLQLPFHYSSDQSTALHEIGVTEQKSSDSKDSRWKVRCPFDFTDSKLSTNNESGLKGDELTNLQGLERVSRHPGLWSFGLIGLGSGMLVRSLPTRAWMSMPVLVALIGGSHIDSRYRRGMGGHLCKEMDEATSNVPFSAMLSGKQGGVKESFAKFGEEIKPINAVLAVGMAAIVVGSRGRGNRLVIKYS